MVPDQMALGMRFCLDRREKYRTNKKRVVNPYLKTSGMLITKRAQSQFVEHDCNIAHIDYAVGIQVNR